MFFRVLSLLSPPAASHNALRASPLPCRLLLEEGPAACLARLPPALDSLAGFLREGIGGPPPFGGHLEPLKARILAVAAASPLLQWALQWPGPAAAAAQLLPLEQASPVEHAASPAGSTVDGGLDALQPLLLPGKLGGGGGVEGDGPGAAVAAGSSRVAALLQLLLELQVDAQLSSEERRRVALVAATPQSLAMLRQQLEEAQQLNSCHVSLLRDVPAAEAGTAPTSPVDRPAREGGDDDAAAEEVTALAEGGAARSEAATTAEPLGAGLAVHLLEVRWGWSGLLGRGG